MGFSQFPRLCLKHALHGVGRGGQPPPPPPFATTMLTRWVFTRCIGFEASFARLKRSGGVGGAQPPPFATTMLT